MIPPNSPHFLQKFFRIVRKSQTKWDPTYPPSSLIFANDNDRVSLHVPLRYQNRYQDHRFHEHLWKKDTLDPPARPLYFIPEDFYKFLFIFSMRSGTILSIDRPPYIFLQSNYYKNDSGYLPESPRQKHSLPHQLKMVHSPYLNPL